MTIYNRANNSDLRRVWWCRHDSGDKQPHILFLYHLAMGIRNYLIEGVSSTGKTSVCNELQRRGYHAIHGDRDLAYQADPETGKPTDGFAHEHHIWHVDKVKPWAPARMKR